MTRFNIKNGSLMTHKISFRLDEKRWNELDACAKHFGTSVSYLVRHFVLRFLEDQRRNNPSSVVAFPANHLGGDHVR